MTHRAASANPHFQPPPIGIQAERGRMLGSPAPLRRPLIVVGGWRTPGWVASTLARDLCRLTGADRRQATSLGVPLSRTMRGAACRIVHAVERAWPSDNPEQTVEVDLIGISMGGLLGRAAALPSSRGERKRLNLRRLFTIGTPHRGATLAARIAVDRLARDMRPGSAFLALLDEGLHACNIELVCYARTHDVMVGATNAAPAGREPFWLPGPRLFSHSTSWADPLIRLDIARRLRDEEPLAQQESRPPED